MDMQITLIRHGVTPGNTKKKYIGITDEGLSEEGENEIRVRSYPEADIVFSSPLLRCKQTARIIYPNADVQVVEQLRETDFGLFEGKNYQELSGNPAYQAWIESGGEDAFPEGESKAEATARSLAGFDKVLQKSKDAKRISVICHGGTIMAILSSLFGGDYYSYHVENGEGYTFDLSFDGVYSGLSARSFTGRSDGMATSN